MDYYFDHSDYLDFFTHSRARATGPRFNNNYAFNNSLGHVIPVVCTSKYIDNWKLHPQEGVVQHLAPAVRIWSGRREEDVGENRRLVIIRLQKER